MSSNNKLRRSQQLRIQHYAQHSDAYSFFNVLTGPALLSRVEDQLPTHRERSFPPTETLSMFLAQVLNSDSSCQKTVNDTAVKRVLGGLSPCSTSTGGYCKARQRLPLQMVATLARETGEQINKQLPDQWRWQGRRVYLVDGTTVTLPDTPENQEIYPQHKGIKPGLGFPICRIVGLVCLASGAILNAATGRFNGKGSSEQTLLRTMLGSFTEGDLIVGDAFFGTYSLLAALLDKGVDAVFEQMGARKRVVDFHRGIRLGAKDHLIELSKPKYKPDWMSQEHYDSLPESLSIRELSVDGRILITTLLSPRKTPKHELKSLYKQRWQIELDFRNIKTTLGMDTLSCKTPEMNEKEIWTYFLAYNLIRLLMVQAALLTDLLPRQLSFKHTVQLWLGWHQSTRGGTTSTEHIICLLMLMAQRQVGNRPGRIEPRAVKKRPKPYPMLMKPRAQAQAEVRKNGHPKKLK